MLAARKVPAAVKWIEDRRENLMSAGQARHEHGVATHGVRRRGHDPRGADRPRAGRRRVPDAVAGRHRRGRRHVLPGSLPHPGGRRGRRARSSPTRQVAPRTAGPWQFESLAREVLLDIAARRIGRRSRRAAPPQHARHGRPALREPERHAVRPHVAARGVRAGTRDARLRRVPPRAGRRTGARSLSRRGHQQLRRADDDGHGLLRDRRGDDPHRAVGQGQRLRRGRLDRQQPRDDRRAAHRRRARRRHRRREHDPGRHRGHPVRARHRREPQRLDDRGRDRRDRDDAPRAHRRHRRPPARGRARTTSCSSTVGRSCGARPPAGCRSPRSRRSRTSDVRLRCRRTSRPGSRPAVATAPKPAIIWANATHVCTCEVDVATGAGHVAALHRQRGLRTR